MSRRKHPEVRRSDLACEALTDARGTITARESALGELAAMLTGTGRGPWPLDHSDLWKWDDGDDVWIVGEDALREGVSEIAHKITSGTLRVVYDEGVVDTGALYTALCQEVDALWSRIGSGAYDEAGLVAHVREEHGDDAAEEIAEAIGYEHELIQDEQTGGVW